MRTKQSSLCFLLWLTTCFGILFGVWKAHVYEPPTHKFPHYAKAKAVLGPTTTVGPNRISLEYAVRNDRDGTLVVSGKNAPSVDAVPNRNSLAACAKWLDAVQFEFDSTPGDFEIIEARVFDHRTRTLLSQTDPAFGWHVSASNRLNVQGLGRQLPAVLDVWLRVSSYDEDNPTYRLSPVAGAEAPLPDGVLAINAIQEGFAGWSSASGFMAVEDVDRSVTAVELGWKGTRKYEPYQAAAVSICGEKHFHRGYVFPSTHVRRHMIRFDLPTEEIDHIELRPHGGNRPFFFEAVQLPAIGSGPFDPPPVVTVATNRGTLRKVLSEFEPLHVAIDISEGDCVSGSRAGGDKATLALRPAPLNPDQAFTLAAEVKGITGLPLFFRLRDAETGILMNESAMRAMTRYRASASMNTVWGHVYMMPLDQIDAIEVSISTDP